MRGDTDALNALIDAGADVNARDRTGYTALRVAADHGRLEMVRKLMQAGADLNTKDDHGWTPLMAAFSSGSFGVVVALIELGAQVDREQLRNDVNKKDDLGRTLIWGQSDKNALRALVGLGADVNDRDISGGTALSQAASSGSLAHVRALIELGADVNAKDKRGWTVLLRASDAGQTEVMQTLIEAGADANSELLDGSNALMRAAYFGKLETARILIPATNVNHRDRDGVSALMLARWTCNRDMERALSLAGAKVDPEEWNHAPRYEDFLVHEIHRGVPAPIDLHSNPQAPMYRTRLREGARKGPNFAGHFTAVSWGCGSNCTASMIVDARSGRVYDGIGDEFAGDFKLNSSLVIADAEFGPAVFAPAGDISETTPVRYYVWNGSRFKLLYEEPCSITYDHRRCGCEIVKEPLAQRDPK